MKIGIFDSGMGGLSVLHRALRMIPEADFIYYADEEHVPYGEKTREQVRGYIDEIIAFMIKKQVDAIVIACNTATFQKAMVPSCCSGFWIFHQPKQEILIQSTTLTGQKFHLHRMRR